jgi:glycosyltransferase involved in cell wall biosynthesis
MKILQAITSLHTGGAEKLLTDSISLYRKMGFEMELLLLNGDETPFFLTLKKSGVKIHYLTKGNIKKIYNPLLVFRIIPYLRKYDVIHVHLFPTLYWVALAKLLTFSKVKLIFTEHSTNNKRRQKTVMRIFDRFIYAQYKMIISISEGVNANIKSHLSFKEDKFQIINNGICLDTYESATPVPLNELGIPGNTEFILMTARFNVQKDPKTLIHAFHLLKNDKLFLIFAGDGPLRNESEKLVRDLQIENRVKFLGVRNDMPDIIKASNICVLSSNWEGFGLVAAEYMASGKPAIVSDVDGLREVVAGAGLLFPAGDEKILTERINELLSDRDYYEKVAQACLGRSKEYDINRMIDQYVKLYNSMQNG